MSNILDRISFWSLFLVIVLLPIFFLPFSNIPVETAKGLLLVLGLVVSIVSWSAARFSDGKIVIPKSWTLVAGLGVVFAFLLSALLSGTMKMSLFGIMFDIGTFWFIFSAYLLMLFSALIFKTEKNAKLLLLGLITSFTVAFVFQISRLVTPDLMSLGVLGVKTDNLIGTWNSFGLFAVMGVIVSLFLIEFYSISRKIKTILGIFIILSVLMIILVNFALAWKLLGIFSLFVFVYKISSYSNIEIDHKRRRFPITSFVVVLVSLLFFVSGQFIGGYLPNKIGISNLEVSPTFTSTLNVAQNVLKQNPVFGIGPNNFGQAWSMYRPELVNSSQYWNTTFFTGSGLMPTFFITTGVLGILAFVFFFCSIFVSGFKRLFVNTKSLSNIETTIFFTMVVFLTTVSFLYAAGVTTILLLFAFCGVFVGLYASNKDKGEITISFLEDPRKSFFSILLLVLMMITSAGLSFVYIQRLASVHYFGKALAAATSMDSFKNISRALELHQNDLYYRTYSQVKLLMITEIVEKSKTKVLTEEEKVGLQTNYDQAVESARLATAYNPNNSLNWELLGSVYHTVSNYGLTTAYDQAIESYNKAAELNSLNPNVRLSITNALMSKDMVKEAKASVAEAIKLKPNYTEALILMSQIEKKQGNNTEALSFAEKALQTLPSNPELIKYVESLRSGNNVPALIVEQEKLNQGEKQ